MDPLLNLDKLLWVSNFIPGLKGHWGYLLFSCDVKGLQLILQF